MELKVIIENDTEQELTFEVKKMINAGRTGRDQDEVRRHVEELRKEEIQTPQEVPSFYPILPNMITTDKKIIVLPESKTSGEAEYVLLIDKNRIEPCHQDKHRKQVYKK